MNKSLFVVGGIILLILVTILLYGQPASQNEKGITHPLSRTEPREPNILNQINPMILTSPSFQENEFIPSKFTCDGGNVNPELQIQNVPPEAKSLALIMDDPDAPSGNFTHWLVWNIKPDTEIIKHESVPPGSVEGRNDKGEFGYTGPCPPSGTHHYHFKLYALKALLNLPAEASKKMLEFEISKNKIAYAELIGLYKR